MVAVVGWEVEGAVAGWGVGEVGWGVGTAVSVSVAGWEAGWEAGCDAQYLACTEHFMTQHTPGRRWERRR